MYEQYPDEFYKLVDTFMATGRYRGRPDAVDAVRRARPDLRPVPRTPEPTRIYTTGSDAGTNPGTAEKKLMAMVKQYADEKHIPFEQAYIEAMNVNMDLYKAYLRERAAAVRGCRG
jgi:hypothetical protein